jgi:hypothetical protein
LKIKNLKSLERIIDLNLTLEQEHTFIFKEYKNEHQNTGMLFGGIFNIQN